MSDRVASKIRKTVVTVIIIVFISVYIALLSISYRSEQQWVLYHCGEIKGEAVAAETQQPVGGAIVVGLWELTQIPGEGFGGYAKIQETTTDKDGQFLLPAWTAFKPWNICSVTHGLGPKIIIYKPGYKLIYGRDPKIMKPYLNRQVRILDQEKVIKKQFSLTPVKLAKTYSDKEIWENYSEFCSQANFPDSAYSKTQLKSMFAVLEESISQLSTNSQLSKNRISKEIKEYRGFYVGGQK